MPQGWKLVVAVIAAAAIVATPLVWLLGSQGTGEIVGASIQAGTGVIALVWAIFSGGGQQRDEAVGTGEVRASDGGRAHSGIRRPGGRGMRGARVENTGNATADGTGSSAGTGIDYS